MSALKAPPRPDVLEMFARAQELEAEVEKLEAEVEKLKAEVEKLKAYAAALEKTIQLLSPPTPQ